MDRSRPAAALDATKLLTKPSRILLGPHRALANFRGAYAMWLEAYGKLTLREYLGTVSKLSETGEKVRELVKFLVQHPESWSKSGA